MAVVSRCIGFMVKALYLYSHSHKTHNAFTPVNLGFENQGDLRTGIILTVLTVAPFGLLANENIFDKIRAVTLITGFRDSSFELLALPCERTPGQLLKLWFLCTLDQ
jgi:hypothetical protein